MSESTQFMTPALVTIFGVLVTYVFAGFRSSQIDHIKHCAERYVGIDKQIDELKQTVIRELQEIKEIVADLRTEKRTSTDEIRREFRDALRDLEARLNDRINRFSDSEAVP
jgi:hypothetical protein